MLCPQKGASLECEPVWFKEGMENTILVSLPKGTQIRIFPLPYFIAIKFEAFFDRGKNDFYGSHDFEDIVTVLAYRNSYDDLFITPEPLLKAFAEYARRIISNKSLMEYIQAHIDPTEPAALSDNVFNLFNTLAVLK